MALPGRTTCVGCLDVNCSVIILMVVITYAEKHPVAVNVNVAMLLYTFSSNTETVKSNAGYFWITPKNARTLMKLSMTYLDKKKRSITVETTEQHSRGMSVSLKCLNN